MAGVWATLSKRRRGNFIYINLYIDIYILAAYAWFRWFH